MQRYIKFLNELDKELAQYFYLHKDFIFCTKGCSGCCKKGDYPLSNIEFNYIMKGYLTLEHDVQRKIKQNITDMIQGELCPFLIENECSIYAYRPIVCRVHGLAYKRNNVVTLPFCANEGKNFSQVYKNCILEIEPVMKNLDTPNLLINFEYGEIRTMYEWFKS